MVVVVPMLCLGCATASKPAPGPLPEPSSPTLQVGDTTVVALSPAPAPCCKKQTLPQFLGVDKLGAGLVGLVRNIGARLSARLDLAGRFPALQDPPPPLLAITDPANLSPDSPPSVQAAAEVKAEEDAAAQKVQALKYLASIGCGGCYPSVEDALLAALDDCTEAVRYEAAAALRGSDASCRYCKSDSCCSAKVKKKLHKIAYETDDTGCPFEPSQRVRREARLSLAACGGFVETTIGVPEEGPQLAPAEEAAASFRASTDDTIELANYAIPSTTGAADDIVLAIVNGEQIFESQIASLAEASLARRGISPNADGRRDTYRAELRLQLSRVIDATRLRQVVAADLGLRQAPTPEQTSDWLERNVAFDMQIEPAEFEAVFTRDSDKYNAPAKVRWERISVPLASFDRREQAHATVSFLMHRASGTQSQPPAGFDPLAIETKTHPWSARSQITSPLIADILFRLPVGRLSPIIEDQNAFHLLRVLERSAPRAATRDEVAERVRQQILAERREAARKQRLAELVSQAQIWTAFQAPPSAQHVELRNDTKPSGDHLQTPPSHELSRQNEFRPEQSASKTAGLEAPAQESTPRAVWNQQQPLSDSTITSQVDRNVERTSALIPIASSPDSDVAGNLRHRAEQPSSRLNPAKLHRLPQPQPQR